MASIKIEYDVHELPATRDPVPPEADRSSLPSEASWRRAIGWGAGTAADGLPEVRSLRRMRPQCSITNGHKVLPAPTVAPRGGQLACKTLPLEGLSVSCRVRHGRVWEISRWALPTLICPIPKCVAIDGCPCRVCRWRSPAVGFPRSPSTIRRWPGKAVPKTVRVDGSMEVPASGWCFQLRTTASLGELAVGERLRALPPRPAKQQ